MKQEYFNQKELLKSNLLKLISQAEKDFIENDDEKYWERYDFLINMYNQKVGDYYSEVLR